MRFLKNITAIVFTILSLNAFSQCDSTAIMCSHNLEGFISDGQLYRALLHDDEVAEFNLTIFGGSTYRIAACSGEEDGNLIFRMFDQEGNLLFTNQDHANAPYWDFVAESTVDCTIEAQLDMNRKESGCAVLLIGFK